MSIFQSMNRITNTTKNPQNIAKKPIDSHQQAFPIIKLGL
ncbi:hypothetical protein L313_1431 [Acinetobacter haemolyticus CIP 64.3 = MTCC 9819]|nr:hypothetical protein L313_1431 [Acinetobacter haemolyticus CIP 64.3 = MTCC 9819]